MVQAVSRRLPLYAHLHNKLLCRHDIDHVTNDEHIESYL